MADREHNTAALIDGVADTIRRFDERWQRTGEKYNLFTVAGIAKDERIICRVLADLLNPRGKHGQGGRYLELFWETLTRKSPGYPRIDAGSTRVATERSTDENRYIDIALDDGAIFVPIEVKIRAGDQPKQLADYFNFAQTINKVKHVPALYLTVDGHEPPDHSKNGLCKKDYVCLSFKDDILDWLQACLREEATTKMVPVWENLRQLTAVIKSLCGKSEDAEMEKAVFEQITKDDDTIRAALAISGEAKFLDRVQKTFSGPALALVKASYPDTVIQKESYYDWYYMEIPVRNKNYLLQVNYDWTSAWLTVPDSRKMDAASPEVVNLNKKMQELFKFEGQGGPKEQFVWTGEDMAWPSLESYVNNDETELYLAHLSKLSAQEVADRIISIAKALESA